jgi:hypothetical protein
MTPAVSMPKTRAVPAPRERVSPTEPRVSALIPTLAARILEVVRREPRCSVDIDELEKCRREHRDQARITKLGGTV